MTSIFQEIPFENLQKLHSLLQKMPHKSISAMIGNAIQLHLLKRLPSSFVDRFYSYNDNLENPENAFIAHIQYQQGYENLQFLLLSYPDDPTPIMLSALEHILDCTKKLVIGDNSSKLFPYIKEFINKFKPGNHDNRSTECYSYMLTVEESLTLDTDADKRQLPKSLDIRELSAITDVPTVDSYCNWHPEQGHDAELIRTSITSVASAGVYVDEELVSWALTIPSGSINMLNTKEDHRRRGYAELTMRALAKLNGTRGIDSIAHVLKNNSASQKLMEKLGFRRTDEFHFLVPCKCPVCSSVS